MLKNILKLDGAQQLSKKEQNAINGGGACIDECMSAGFCSEEGSECVLFSCNGEGFPFPDYGLCIPNGGNQ